MLANLQHLPPGEPLLVGVSGGADSVALLDLLVQSGYRPHIAHLNHQWRGAESDADAEFVRELAGKYGLQITLGEVSNLDQSRLKTAPTERTEDAARQARFAFFESIGIANVALAHTADDQVETILMRLIRGAGMTGLAGMWPEKEMGALRIYRPLLGVRRQEVIEYLKSRQLTWHEDTSNADRRFLRNRIRHELLPLLERDYNPGIRDVLLRTAEILRAEAEGDPVAAQRRAIRQLSFEQVEAIRKQAKLPEPITDQWPLNLAGETVLRQLAISLFCHSERSEEPHKVSASTREPAEALRFAQDDKSGEERFDADALGDAPFVRTWQPGDRFQPLGMTSGEKKLQDFFVDEKIPRRQRGRVPLLCATDGRIAWVVGHRIAEPFKVTKHSRRILQIALRG